MSLVRRSRSRQGQPLLPAASLEGLEQFVHPFQTWPPAAAAAAAGDQRESWKFKPLPELPRKPSSEYSRSMGNLEHCNSRSGIYGHVPNNNDLSLSSSKGHSSSTDTTVVRRAHHESFRSSTNTSPRRQTPMLNLREQYQQTSVDAQGRWIIRQSSSPALLRSRPWAETASFRETEWSWVPEGDISVRRDTAVSEYTGSTSLLDIPSLVPPSSPKTVDSIDPSLIPPPLGFDVTMTQQQQQVEEVEDGDGGGEDGVVVRKIRRERSPLLMVENSDPDICLCHSPHPRHNRVMSVSRLASVAKRDLPPSSQKGSKLREPLAIVVPSVDDRAPSRLTPTRIPKEEYTITNRNKRKDKDRDLLEGPNRTRLYSFSTSASTSMLVTETYQERDVDTSDTERPNAPYPSPRLSRSSSLPSSSAPPHPFLPLRTKQLAIPPTDYQKYGPQIWSKNKSKSKFKLIKDKEKQKEKDGHSKRHGIASYFRKLFPKAFSSSTPSSTPTPPTPPPPPPPPPPPAVPTAPPPRPPSCLPPLTNSRSNPSPHPPSRPGTPALHQPYSAPLSPPFPYTLKSDRHHSYTNITPISPSFSHSHSRSSLSRTHSHSHSNSHSNSQSRSQSRTQSRPNLTPTPTTSPSPCPDEWGRISGTGLNTGINNSSNSSDTITKRSWRASSSMSRDKWGFGGKLERVMERERGDKDKDKDKGVEDKHDVVDRDRENKNIKDRKGKDIKAKMKEEDTKKGKGIARQTETTGIERFEERIVMVGPGPGPVQVRDENGAYWL